ncbi:uncharacterized protein LOC129600688 isoform X2 [Paramacrobiotus metropolitanus]|nr:uncharacterized protein LOC129600688 isoform X2 [Paramacrobiotus metropolitanus]
MDEFMETLQCATTTADAAVREGLRQLSQPPRVVALSTRLRVQCASVCQLILMDQRSRIQVLSATLTAPGELSPTATDALQRCREEDKRIVVDAADILQRFLRHILPQQLHSELDGILTPLLARLQTRDTSDVSDFLSTLDATISLAARVLAGLQGEFFETTEISETPALIRDLDALALLTRSGRFDPTVTFAVGRHRDYPASDWQRYPEYYRGKCRVFVHAHWVYAVARLGSGVSGGVTGSLLTAFTRAMEDDAYAAIPMLALVALDVADRLGGGTVYYLVCELVAYSFTPFRPTNKPPSPKTPIAGRVSYRNESLLQAFIQIADILGPSTQVQYCLSVHVSPRVRDDDPFWATLYLFRRVAFPRASHQDSAAAEIERSRGLEVDCVRLCNDDVQAMSREDLRRVFDIDLVAKHHADGSNYMQPLQLPLELQYPDGSSRQFTVNLSRLFEDVYCYWEEDYRTRTEDKPRPAHSVLRYRDSEKVLRTQSVLWRYWRT